MLPEKPPKMIYPKHITKEMWEKVRFHLTMSIMWLITLRPCHVNALSPISQIVLWSAENIISTFSEQQSVLTLTSHLWFSSNSIISFKLERLLKTPKRNHRLMRDSRKAEKKCEKGETYFSTSCIRFTNSSSEPPMSKKSSITVPSTPFLAHDIRASESSGEKKVAAPDK